MLENQKNMYEKQIQQLKFLYSEKIKNIEAKTALINSLPMKALPKLSAEITLANIVTNDKDFVLISSQGLAVEAGIIYINIPRYCNINLLVYLFCITVKLNDNVKSIFVKWNANITWVKKNGDLASHSECDTVIFRKGKEDGEKMALVNRHQISPTPPKTATLFIGVTITEWTVLME